MGNNSNGTREEESSKQYRHHFQFQKKKHKPLHLVLEQQQQHHHHHKLKPRELDLNDEAVQGFEPSTSVTRSHSHSHSHSHSQRDVMSKSKFTTREREMGGSSSSCKALWPENAIGALLGMFEEFQASCSISVGSTHQMGKTHWGRIAHALNTACNTSYTGVQCKYKWNRLKKSYTKAKQRGDNSRFPFFSHVDRIVRHALSRKRLTSFAPPPPPKKPSGLKSDAPSVMDDEDDDEDEEDTKGEDDELEDEDDDVDSTCEGAATNESKPSSDSSPSHSRSEEDFQDDDDEDINENGVDDDEEEEEEENFVGLASSSKGSKLRSGLKLPTELQPVSVSLACFGQRMESSITKLASAMENIEKTRAQEIKSLVDAQLQITTLMLRDRTSKNYDGVSVDRGQPIVDIGSLQLNHGRNTILTPPVNFAMVDNGLYRSGLPTASNFAFLKTLRLRTIIYLCPDPYPEGSLEFLKAEGIRIFQFAVKIFKEPMTNRPEVTVRDALKTIFDVRNHPLLIHSKREEGSTSFMIGCFRKMQNWCLASIFEEYRRFSGPEFDMSDLEFIECYDTFNTSTMHNYSSFSQVR